MRAKTMRSLIPTIVLCLIVSAAFATERLVPDQYETIQAAIDDCDDGDVVMLAPGTYTGDGNRDIDFHGKAITVRSTDPNNPDIVATTIIDCNGTHEHPHRGFYFHSREDASSIVDGLIIANGYQSDEPGGAIYCMAGSPTIRNCVITGNSAYKGGGGFYYTDRSWPQLTNSILWANLDSTGRGQTAQIRGRCPQVMFSCIQDDDPNDDAVPFSEEDNGNIDDNPLFVRQPDDGGDGWGTGDNDDFGDIHLRSNSPCINAGFPGDYVARDSLDIDGQPRLIGLRIDMGADEAAPMVIVTKPQGGEVWASGSTHEVEWSSYGLTTLNILFSADGGGNWQVFDTNLPDMARYVWHLPDTADSNQCSILLVPSIPDLNAVTIASGLFTIHPDLPGLTVQSKWKSLGGDFDRAGLSQDSGP